MGETISKCWKGSPSMSHVHMHASLQVLRPGGQFLCLEFSPKAYPGLQSLYDFYSFNIIPQIGKCVHTKAQMCQITAALFVAKAYIVYSTLEKIRPTACRCEGCMHLMPVCSWNATDGNLQIVMIAAFISIAAHLHCQRRGR